MVLMQDRKEEGLDVQDLKLNYVGALLSGLVEWEKEAQGKQ